MTTKRPIFITIVSWLLLIDSVLIILGIFGLYVNHKLPPDMEMTIMASVICGAIATLIIATGMMAMQRWAGYAYVLVIITYWVGCYLGVAGTSPVPAFITIGIQVIVCVGVLMHHHEMEPSTGNGYITSFGGLIFLTSVLPVAIASFFGQSGTPVFTADDAHVRNLAECIVRDGIESNEAHNAVQETFYSGTKAEPSDLADKLQKKFKELGHTEFGVTMPTGEHRVLIRNNDSGNAISVTLEK